MGLLERKVTKEMAEKDFYAFCDDWDIDYENLSDEKQVIIIERDAEGKPLAWEEPEESEKEAFEKNKKKLLKAFINGRLVYVREKMALEYTTKRPVLDGRGKVLKENMVFQLKSGHGLDAWTLTDKDMKRPYKVLHNMIAQLAGLPVATIGQTDQIDLKYLNAVASLFNRE